MHNRINVCTIVPMHQITNAPINKCINAPMHQITNALTHQYTKSLMHHCTDAPLHQCRNTQTSQRTNEKMHQCTNALTHQWSNTPKHQRINKSNHQCTNLHPRACKRLVVPLEEHGFGALFCTFYPPCYDLHFAFSLQHILQYLIIILSKSKIEFSMTKNL